MGNKTSNPDRMLLKAVLLLLAVIASYFFFPKVFFTLLLFMIVVIIHEFGHFIVARACGIKVEKFSVGFGPEVIGYEGRKTRYCISSVPLGGYVKIKGMGDGNADYDSYNSKPRWQRLSVICAGVSFNLISAFLLFFVVMLLGHESGKVQVVDVVNGSPAQHAGVMPGDFILSVNGSEVFLPDDIQLLLSESELPVVVLRSGKKAVLSVRPKRSGEKLFMGISLTFGVVKERHSFMSAFGAAWRELKYIFYLNYYGLKRVFEGRTKLKNTVGGPVMIGKIAGDTAEEGSGRFIHFIGLVSIALAIMNALPILPLDGGHAVVIVAEAVRRKPIDKDKLRKASFIGFVLFIMLFLVICYNDIMRFWG